MFVEYKYKTSFRKFENIKTVEWKEKKGRVVSCVRISSNNQPDAQVKPIWCR